MKKELFLANKDVTKLSDSTYQIANTQFNTPYCRLNFAHRYRVFMQVTVIRSAKVNYTNLQRKLIIPNLLQLLQSITASRFIFKYWSGKVL